MAKLKPCPFCGGNARVIAFKEDGIKVFYVKCMMITCMVKTRIYKKINEAMFSWNRREGVR